MTDKTEGAPGELSQAEKLETVLNDARVARERNASTLAQFALSEFDEPRGRFTTTEKAAVIGVTPPSYPKGPDWAVDPCGPEPPLGVDVNAQQPTGEGFEVERSIRQSAPSEEKLED